MEKRIRTIASLSTRSFSAYLDEVLLQNTAQVRAMVASFGHPEDGEPGQEAGKELTDTAKAQERRNQRRRKLQLERLK